MPLPMVHLAIAVRLGEHCGQFPSPAFLLGSIAPDAIHMRPNIQSGDKQVTHLSPDADPPDHAHIRALFIQHAELPAFTSGYAAHVLTDRLWTKQVIEPFRAAIPPSMDDSTRRTLYYQETDQVDCNLYKTMPWLPQVWSQLTEAEAPDFLPLLTSHEIHLWRSRTLSWFDDPAHEPHITPQYLTDALVAQFIDDAAEQVAAQFAAWQMVNPLV